MPTALIIATKKTPMRPSDSNATPDYRMGKSAKPYGGKEDAAEESAEEKAKYSVEVPLEGEEIEATAPEGVDLAEVPQTGRAIVEYTLQCAPDGGSCKVILGKICFAGEGNEAGEDESAGEDAGEMGEEGESEAGGGMGSGGFANALKKAMGKQVG